MTLKKKLKKIFRKQVIFKTIVIASTLALLATSVLPFFIS